MDREDKPLQDIDRRAFLKTSGVAATVATVSGAAGAQAASTAGADTTSAIAASPQLIGRAPQPFILAVPQSLSHIEVMTAAHRLAHRLTTVFAGARTVAVETIADSGLDAVRSGRADAYLGLESQHHDHHPAFQLVSGLPIGTDIEPMLHHAWLTAGYGRDLWQSLSRDHGAVAFAAFHTGQSPGLFAEKIFSEGADFRGARIAARGLGARVLATLGADIVTLPDADLQGAITALELDAAEPLMAPTAAVAHWSFGQGVTPSGHILSLGLSLDLWERLSPSQKIGIEGLAAETALQSYGAARLLQATSLRINAWRRWPIHSVFGAGLNDALAAAGVAVVADLAGHDAIARQFVESLEQLRDGVAVVPWMTSPALV